jgi:peroxiredoxin
MKILLIATCVCITLLTACGSKGFKVNGQIDNMVSQKFYVEKNGAAGKEIVDSGRTQVGGTFSFDGTTEEPNMYRVRFEKGKYILLTLHNDDAKIKGDWNNLESYEIAGSAGSSTLQNLLTALRSHIRDVNTLDAVTNSFGNKSNKDSIVGEVKKSLDVMNKDFASYVKNFADTTALLPNAVFAANLINPRVDTAFINKFYSGLTNRFPKSILAQEFYSLYANKNNLTAAVVAPNTSNTGAAPTTKPNTVVSPAGAKPAPDFSANTPEGKAISLSSFSGQYVLLDFWASWCGPCRMENPNVVAAYNKYKAKNFTVLSVSLDDSKEKWEEGIAKDGLTWTNVSDLQKWGSVPARMYNVQSIPTNFLIDPNGNIIGENLRGGALEAKLAAILK